MIPAAFLILLGGIEFLGVLAHLTGLRPDRSIKVGLEVPTLVVDASAIVAGFMLAWRPTGWGRLFFSFVAFDLAFTYGWVAMMNYFGGIR